MMNGIMNGIMNRGGCFHHLQKNGENGNFSKRTPGPEKQIHLEGDDPTPQVLNKNCPWVPQQEQNAFIFH